ncbi:MAG: PaaI family thioesterase [Candidatus Faecousia sp.]|nr:PaaI family thioesterase [Candidatus Faecousia sp.]
MGEKVRRRIEEVNRGIPGSIAEMMQFRLTDCDLAHNDFTMICETLPWMRNFSGTLHGGICATILDQAMGFVACCLTTGEYVVPTVQLKVDYHRPLHPGEDVIVKVHVVNVAHTLINLTAEAYSAGNPEKISLSGSGIYFCKPIE